MLMIKVESLANVFDHTVHITSMVSLIPSVRSEYETRFLCGDCFPILSIQTVCCVFWFFQEDNAPVKLISKG